MSLNDRKVVIVGDGTVGKTCLMETFVSGCFPVEYISTIFDEKKKIVVDGDTSTMLNLWDTAGQEGYARLRALGYAACIVFCYAINDRDSLRNIWMEWYPEVRKQVGRPLCVLVGTKCDLRQCNEHCVSTAEGQRMMRRIGAAKFIECSAKHNLNVDTVFLKVARTIRRRENRNCTIYC